MYQLIFYVPTSDLKRVKEALFEKGAGKMGQYESCCWQTKGESQFRALPGSDPERGEIGEMKHVEEYKVEMVVADDLLEKVVATLKEVHPYEEVGYSFYAINKITHEAKI